MRRAWPLLLVVSVLGCRHGLSVQTRSDVNLSGRVETRFSPPAVSPTEPVVAMPASPGADPCAPRVAVIDVDGVLVNAGPPGLLTPGENPVSLFREKLDAVAADPLVRAVVLRVNSPGGSVTATDLMWHELRTFRQRTGLPVVASLMDVGTGGAYYLATAADAIVALPTTVTGGVGVILNLYNLHELMLQFNIIPQTVKAGEYIDMGTPAQMLPEEVRAMFQRMADEYHERFKAVVRAARPNLEERGGTTFDGRVFGASEALERGLIDRTGYLEDAVALAKELAGVEAAELFFYRRPGDPALSAYAVTPNVPHPTSGLAVLPNIPGLDRSKLPAFLYMWQPEMTLERVGR